MKSRIWLDEYEWQGRQVKVWRLKLSDPVYEYMAWNATFNSLDEAIAWRADVELGYVR